MIKSLSLQEKMTAMELIWRDLSAEPESFPSLEWHGAVIDDRLANPVSERSLTLTEARQSVHQALTARRTQN